MKKIVDILTIVLMIAFIFNLIKIDYNENLFVGENAKYVIGTVAAVCGLILAIIFLRFFHLQKNLEK